MNFPNLEELSFLRVTAFPKLSNRGLALSTFRSSSPTLTIAGIPPTPPPLLAFLLNGFAKGGSLEGGGGRARGKSRGKGGRAVKVREGKGRETK